jgi:arsenate reductase (thioredoxin)
MGYRTFNVLILCTGNSARSIMAEALFNTMGHGMFKAYSAGSSPTGVVSRFAIEEIRKTGYPTENLRSKSWDEFSQPGAPEMDFVITVCDNSAKEVCPFWHGRPVTAHWGFEDPAAVEGSFGEKKEAFKRVFLQIRNRIDLLTQLPLAHLDKMSQKHEIEKIGKELAD